MQISLRTQKKEKKSLQGKEKGNLQLQGEERERKRERGGLRLREGREMREKRKVRERSWVAGKGERTDDKKELRRGREEGEIQGRGIHRQSSDADLLQDSGGEEHHLRVGFLGYN